MATRWGAAPATDWTSAARTGRFDVDSRTWATDTSTTDAGPARWLGGDADLSRPVPPGTPIGNVSAGVAERLGVSRRTVLVAGLHQPAAAFVGAGGRAGLTSVVALGPDGWLAVGTAERPAWLIGPGFASYPYDEDRWLTLAGLAPATIDGTPDRGDLESAGHALAAAVEALAQAGVSCGELRVVGGSAAEAGGLAIPAAVSGRSLVPAPGHAAARGAAMIAAIGIGRYTFDDLPPAPLGPPAHP